MDKKDVDFIQLKKDVDLLTFEQQKELLDHLALKLRNGKQSSESTRDMDLWEMSLLENVAALMGSVPQMIPRKTELFKSFKESYEELRKFIAFAKCTNLDVYEKRAFYSYVAKMLVRSSRSTCQHLDIPFSIKFVLQQSKNIPALFDAAFPSYIESGLVKIVIKQLGFGGN